MYICKCGAVFKLPAEDVVDHGYHGGIYETVKRCPHCGRENYTEAIKCLSCHKWMPETDVKGTAFCWECRRRLDKKISELLKNGLTLDERLYMEDRIGEYGVFYFTGEDEKQ